MDKKQLHVKIELALATIGDPVLIADGFTRKKRTLLYRRECSAGEQWILVDFKLPRYSDDPTLCHIELSIGASFSEVNSKAVYLVDGNTQLVGFLPDVTYALPVGLCGPENALKQWRPGSIDDLQSQIQDMIVYLRHFGLPFLAEYQTPASLVRGYLNGDHRFMRGHTFVLRVISAALCTNQKSKANEIAKSTFGISAGTRRRYAVLFGRLRDETGSADYKAE